MAYDIVIGRTKEETEKYGTKGTVFIGKTYVKVGPYTSLSNNLFLDVANPHKILISGKTGSGKSYSASVIAEEMARLPQEVKKNLSVLFFDTLGVFWTMKYPNTRQQDLLLEWGLKPEGMNIEIYTPAGFYNKYKEAGIPTDHPFTIKTSELTPGDWANVFEARLNDPIGIIIERMVGSLKENQEEYSIQDIIQAIEKDEKSKKEDKDATINRFSAADKWGLFEKHGTPIDELIKPGGVTVLDISAYTEVSGSWSIKALVIGLISRKLLIERIEQRKKEELESMEKLGKLFLEQKELERPMVWVMLDECVTGDTEIITHTNHTKMEEVVKKFENGEEVYVLSYDNKKEEYIHKKVEKIHKIPKREIIRLITECGREIKCTPDHPMLTKNGYLSAISAKELAFPLVQHYSEDKEAIKARLMGYLYGDGWLCKNKTAGFSGKKLKGDLMKIKEDLTKLDLKSSKINSRPTTSKIKNEFGKVANVNGESHAIYLSKKAFAFFRELGAPVGEKVLQEINLPSWISKGSNKIKSEFLAGLLGSDGNRISAAKNAKGDFNPIRISFNKDCKLKREAIKFANQIKKLFEDLGINISNIKQRTGNLRKDGIKTMKIVITLAKNNKNTIKFLEKIGYRYCSDKEKQALLWLEYLMARETERTKRERLKIKAKELNRIGLGKTRVSRLLKIKEYEARDLILDKHKCGVPKSFDSFQDWINKRVAKDFILEKVDNVEACGVEDVYDITVNETHNFIANSLISHNCHEFLPRVGETPATSALIQLIREGRQPGISLIAVTQQPGEIHQDVLTQSDIIISHRLTAKADIDALNSMMQSYLLADIHTYINELPRLPGSAIILDDKAERIYPMKIHPKRSWHGGEAPSALREGKKPELKL